MFHGYEYAEARTGGPLPVQADRSAVGLGHLALSHFLVAE